MGSNCGSCNSGVTSVPNGVDEISSAGPVAIDYVPSSSNCGKLTTNQRCPVPVSVPCPPAVVTGCVPNMYTNKCGNVFGAGSACGCGCGCGGCSTGVCCQNTAYANPQPYYAAVPMCKEDHNKNTIIIKTDLSFKITNSWNIPACNQVVEWNVPGLSGAVVGSYVGHPTYGIFQVTSYDTSTHKMQVTNICYPGNFSQSAPGTTVPACTLFTIQGVVLPSADGGGGGSTTGPYLAVDFTAPAVSACILITVTNVSGISVDKRVQIASGTYRVQAINTSSTITICNDGDGAIAGTSVIARNSAGEFQYPVITLDSNPCTNSAVDDGSPIVCKDGNMSPVAGTVLGQVLRLTDIDTNTWTPQILAVPNATCTALTACLTLSTGVAIYTLTVADSSVFIVGDILQIGTRTDRLTITSIPDATHIIGTMDPVPTSITVIEAGTSVCVQDCCSTIIHNVTEDPCYVNTGVFAVADIAQLIEGSGQITVSGGSVTFGDHNFTIANPSTCKNLYVMVNITHIANLSFQGAANSVDKCDRVLTPLYGQSASVPIGTAPLPVLVAGVTVNNYIQKPAPLADATATARCDATYTFSNWLGIGPGLEVRIRAATQVTAGSMTGGGKLNYNGIGNTITYVGSAIPV